MSKIRTEISIESSESFVVRRKRYSIRSWCDCCDRIAIFVLPTEAGFLAGLDVDTIVSLVCAGDLHVFKTVKRGTYVCLASLCLLNQTSNYPEDAGGHEYTKLSPGMEESGFLLEDLKKL
ncbi:MAG: hypothetical protein HKN33_12025 [Pyrinomonadaceae bacterium]|nr:hypothetical protein [Pyrinomonadaceae bacterium]